MLLVIAVIVSVGFAGYSISKKKGGSKAQQSSQTSSSMPDTGKVGQKSCAAPPTIRLPVASQRIKSVLYPGQVRGNNFKPHGGFILNNSNDAAVTLPLSAKVIDGVRYNEMGEVQYMFDFEADCGYRFRLDHLNTLTADFQKIADQLPAPTESSQTTRLSSGTFDAGTAVASKVGFVKIGNTAFDFGLYDMNKQNDASKAAGWPQDFQHQTDLATHGVCWFDYLTASDATLIRGLPAGDGQQGTNSVYCN
jgi:hypothetical protein